MPCPLCDDTGWRSVEASSGESGNRRVVRCECWRENVNHHRLADANIPKRYQHCTIANFRAYNESLERAAGQASRMADQFPAGQKGLFLAGQPGGGKPPLVPDLVQLNMMKKIQEDLLRKTQGAHRGYKADREDLTLQLGALVERARRRFAGEARRPGEPGHPGVEADELDRLLEAEWVPPPPA